MSTSHKDRAVRAPRQPRARWLSACLTAGVLATAAAAAAQPSFTGLGFLPTGNSSYVSDMSADGTVVVGMTYGAGWRSAMRWTVTDGMQPLSSPGVTEANVGVISDDGTVVVGTCVLPQSVGQSVCRWQAGIGWRALGMPPVPQSFSLSTVSGDTNVVAGSAARGGNLAGFRWSVGTGWEWLPDLLGLTGFQQPYRLNGDGSVMVGSDLTSEPHRAFRKRNGSAIEWLLAPAPWTTTDAFAVSTDGTVVAGWCRAASLSHAAVWNAQGEMLDLGTLGSDTGAHGEAISGDGSTVGGISYSATHTRAFVWHRRSGMIDVKRYLQAYGLDMTGWMLSRTFAISHDGRTIAGNGTHNGRDEAWVATLGALPCGLADGFGAGVTPGADGELTCDDLMGFLTAFLAGQPAGDVGGIGGTNGSDDQFTADDVIVFLAAFFAGCP